MKRTSWWLLTAAILISMSARADNITFADANVKALCVANWDTDHDEQLSTEEAAAVTTLGTVFREKTTITTFNELQFFTGLTSINSNAFYKSTIEQVTFPSTVTAIGEYAFSQSNIGTELVIPGTVKTIGNHAYYNCKRLNRVILQEGVETVGWHTFSGPIAVLSLPTTLTYMSSMAVDPYGATIPQGDYFYVYTHSTIPANIDDFAFYPSFAEGHLVVPPGCIDAYKAVPGWSHFGEYKVLGDTNGDGMVNIQDQINLVTHLLGRHTEVFIEEAADVNGDGVLNTQDAIGIIEIMLNK